MNEDIKEQRFERSDETDFLRHIFQPRLAKLSEFLGLLTEPCGQFNSCIPFSERLRVQLLRALLDLKLVPETYAIVEHPYLNWTYLLHYLHQKGLIENPYFLFPPLYHSQPNVPAVSLKGIINYPGTPRLPTQCESIARGEDIKGLFPRALGEFLERYFLANYPQLTLVQYSANELRGKGENFINPGSFTNYSGKRKKSNNRFDFNDDSKLSWVLGKSLFAKRKTYIPAQVVFWNFVARKEPLLFPPCTSGAAGYSTYEGAVVRGMYELVERENFLLYWLNGRGPRSMEWRGVRGGPDWFKKLQDRLTYIERRFTFQVFFFDSGTDVDVPSCVCVIVDPVQKTFSVAGSAGFDMKRNLTQSLEEALGITSFAYQQEPQRISGSYIPFSNPKIDRDVRIAMWRGEEMLKKAEFWFSGEKTNILNFIARERKFESEGEELSVVAELIREKTNGDIYVYEAKSPILRRLGYHVVKVVVPEMVPLYLNEDLAVLDSKRLRSVPQKLGWKVPKEFNPWPHPFP